MSQSKIDELERLLNSEEDTPIQILPNGEIREIGRATAADMGGMDALVTAAKAEGTLNVIALPPDWANYGAMIKQFGDKYGIKVDSAQPDASSQDEINAANQLKGTDRAPDVFDLGASVALANTASLTSRVRARPSSPLPSRPAVSFAVMVTPVPSMAP